jgi:glycerophosphoryl diester phosphodiesterase
MTPTVVAHRGASHEIAEHTLAAYQEAITVGADALECDVRLTADGHLVCVHDRTLKRVAGSPGVVSEMELADMADLDFHSWKQGWATEPDLMHPRGGVLTLRTLLETVRDAGRRVELAIETKHPTRYGGLVERRLAEMLTEFGWDQAGAPVRVMSFQYTALQRMDRLTPELRKVLLIDKSRYWPFYERVVAPTQWWLGPGVRALQKHPKFAKKLVRTGRPLYVWTINDEADLQTCLDLGVSEVATDRPAWARATLSARGQEVPSQDLLRADS